MTKKEQLLLLVTRLDEDDCEYVLKILSEETRKDFKKRKCEFAQDGCLNPTNDCPYDNDDNIECWC